MESKLEIHETKVGLGVLYNLLEQHIKGPHTSMVSIDDIEVLNKALDYINQLEKENETLRVAITIQKDLADKYKKQLYKPCEMRNAEDSKPSCTVTKEQIDNILKNSSIAAEKYGNKTTIVKATLPNGFVIIESSSCVDPNNFDMAIGEQICMERIENKIWELEGYKLQDRC